MPSDTPNNDMLNSLAALAPLIGGIAVEGLAIARNQTPADDTPGAFAADVINRAERIHDYVFRAGATDRIINQECADLAAVLVARIISHGGLPS